MGTSDNNSSKQNKNNQLVYLAQTDVDVANTLKEQCTSYGYQIKQFNRFDKLMEALTTEDLPLVIVMDLDLGGTRFAGVVDVIQMLEQYGQLAPFIFTTKNCNIQSCLESVRANGAACIKVPDESQQIIEKINGLSAKHTDLVYRVLMVTTEGSEYMPLADALQKSGIKVHCVFKPFTLFEEIIDFRPDIILMDIFLENCSGIQLARVIRQDANFLSIPIAFISEEGTMQQEFDPLVLGGDEFIATNRSHDLLINAIKYRAERARILNSLMVKDSLTGLYNHSKTMELVSIEVSRAKRDEHTLCFAMIDIDKFKSINDTYGHAVGDTVIKALSRLLTQRLRCTDAIGRYGGEEFAIIFPNTELGEAEDILNQLRKNFEMIEFKSQDTAFHVSFSGGLTCFKTGDNEDIQSIADQALYQAKHGGRNRIIVIENSKSGDVCT